MSQLSPNIFNARRSRSIGTCAIIALLSGAVLWSFPGCDLPRRPHATAEMSKCVLFDVKGRTASQLPLSACSQFCFCVAGSFWQLMRDRLLTASSTDEMKKLGRATLKRCEEWGMRPPPLRASMPVHTTSSLHLFQLFTVPVEGGRMMVCPSYRSRDSRAESTALRARILNMSSHYLFSQPILVALVRILQRAPCSARSHIYDRSSARAIWQLLHWFGATVSDFYTSLLPALASTIVLLSYCPP
ncbi:hypothetical protein C8Q78DRAFT_717004 [Trametes maxima]|nr:hypothetical protein C8Q78DRAFT_717004 [Trametes maxima]